MKNKKASNLELTSPQLKILEWAVWNGLEDDQLDEAYTKADAAALRAVRKKIDNLLQGESEAAK